MKSNDPSTKCFGQMIFLINGLVICMLNILPFDEVPLAEPVSAYESSNHQKNLLSHVAHSRLRLQDQVMLPPLFAFVMLPFTIRSQLV